MTWSGAITALEAHMLAAAPAHSQRAGDPGLPPRKTAAWYYVGTGENPLIPETLTDHSYAESVEVRFYWPVATRDVNPSRTLENDVRNITRTLIARLQADRDLGGNCSDLTIGDANAGWLESDGGVWRVSTIPLSLGFTDLEPIAR